MKYLSLFSGIGGFEIGISNAHEALEKSVGNRDHAPERAGDWGGAEDLPPERADATTESVPVLRGRPVCVGFSEIDRHASSVYKRHFPNHRELGDITKIDAATLPDFDLLVGGFPCQAFSIAGKRLGFDDTRGTLFFEIARILAVKRPKNFVLENVRGLLSHDAGRTFRTILGTINDLGYCVEWQVLNSKDFGVPQNRERVYIVGHLGGIPRRKVFPLCGYGSQVAQEYVGSFGTPRLAKDDHLSRGHKQPARVFDPSGVSPTLSSGETQGRYNIAVVKDRETIRNIGDSASCLDANYLKGIDNHGARTGISDGFRIRRLTPTECERLQAFPDGWTDTYHDCKPVSDTQRYKMCGNAVTTSVVAAVVGRLLAVDNYLDTETSQA